MCPEWSRSKVLAVIPVFIKIFLDIM